MTREETAKVLHFLLAVYRPNVKLTEEEAQITLDAWYEILAPLAFEDAYEAAKRIVRQQEIPVVPTVGRIYAVAREVERTRLPKPWYMEG
jgi:hypothetical protein